MKTKAISITIPQPCGENWNKMKNLGGNKFCLSCQKTVVDFTGKSADEIVKLMTAAKGETMCGRLSSKQLQQLSYHLIPVRQSFSLTRHLGVLSLGALLLMASCSKSTPEQPQPIAKIYGYVVDGRHKPVVGVQVSIDGTKLSSTTDNNGKYEFLSSKIADKKYHRLVVDHAGSSSFADLNYNRDLQDTVKVPANDYAVMGLMIMVPPVEKK